MDLIIFFYIYIFENVKLFMIKLLLNIYKYYLMIRQAIKSINLGRFLYGNLKDSDRIFTNVYKDGDPYINGALKRVHNFINYRVIGIVQKI